MANNGCGVPVFSAVRCVTFDLDDTLWPCKPTITKAERGLYSWLQRHYPRVTRKYTFEEVKLRRAAYGKTHPEIAHNLTELRRRALAELAGECDYSSRMADEGLAVFLTFRNRVRFFDDAHASIDRLKGSYKIGAITNGNADLQAIGVRDKFDFVVTAAMAGVAKPDAGIFQHAQHQAGLASHEMLLVGDLPDVDVMAARKCGWRTVWFNPGKTPWPEKEMPDAEIQRLGQLIPLLLDQN